MIIQTNREQAADTRTDADAFCICPPDDPAHDADDLLDWYEYGFVCLKEFATRNLIAFRTGGENAYPLRLTRGDLTAAEQAKKTNS